MIENYLKHEAYRAEKGIPALPLDANQTKELCELLQNPPAGKDEFLLNLFTERIAPGVDPAAEVKASFLNDILKGQKVSSLISKAEAIQILGTMIGGYNVFPLIDALKDNELAQNAVEALKNTTLVYDNFDTIVEMSKSNEFAMQVLTSWANADWFTTRKPLPETETVKVYKLTVKLIPTISHLHPMHLHDQTYHCTLYRWVNLYSQKEMQQ